MPVHDAYQELRFGHVELNLAALALHKGCCLLSRPCALRFIEDDDLLDRYIVVSDVMIPKMVNILYETSNFALSIFLRNALAICFVAGKRLA